MSENGEIYTAGNNFTLPPAVTALTNSTSAAFIYRNDGSKKKGQFSNFLWSRLNFSIFESLTSLHREQGLVGMASSDRGLVRRVTCFLPCISLNFCHVFLWFFAMYFSESENSISRQERRARTGRYGTLAIQQSRRCRHEELAGHKARLNVPPQSAGARHTVHTCPLLENICSEDFSIFAFFNGALSLVIILTSQVRLNPRLSKLDSKMLDVWRLRLFVDIDEMSREGGNHRLLWHHGGDQQQREWEQDGDELLDHDLALLDGDDLLAVWHPDPARRRLQRHRREDCGLCQPRLLQPVHQAPHGKSTLNVA